jgi:hypothetical protein
MARLALPALPALPDRLVKRASKGPQAQPVLAADLKRPAPEKSPTR